MPGLDITLLRPYLSLLLLERPARVSRRHAFNTMFADALDLLGLRTRTARGKIVGPRLPIGDPVQWTLGKSRVHATHYECRTPPAWWPNPPSTVLDTTQELLLFYQRADNSRRVRH